MKAKTARSRKSAKDPEKQGRSKPSTSDICSAKRRINHFIAEGFLDRSEDWLKAWYRYDLKYSESSPSHVTIPRKNLAPLLDEARRNRDVYDLVEHIVNSKRAADIDLTEPLASFQVDVEAGRIVRPKGSRGRPNNWGRDFIILNVLDFMTLGDPDDRKTWRRLTANRELKGTKNISESASEVVFLALPHTKIGHVARRVIEKLTEEDRKRKEHDEARSLYLVGLLDDLDDLDRV
ncbi:hypothetical protein HCU73_08480 [Roseibacterium sp. KMU-115]|uniref:Uncharacterized protein n=2 Tax=Roseicyclus persicicus TaxID=2650661 RepID=A0A7X6JZA9_9RHOB|nr:hypothetical protein [Roseibacterium persicicum]